MQVIRWFKFVGAFRKLFIEIPGLGNERSSHPYFKKSPLIFVMPCSGTELSPQKHIRVKQGEKLTKWV